jgi:hypothetical protein
VCAADGFQALQNRLVAGKMAGSGGYLFEEPQNNLSLFDA